MAVRPPSRRADIEPPAVRSRIGRRRFHRSDKPPSRPARTVDGRRPTRGAIVHTASLTTAPPPRRGFPITRIASLARRAVRSLETLTPLVDLAVRIGVASVFFKSGLSKLA